MKSSITIVTIVGARPQFIKAATVSREIRSRSNVDEVMIHTGQHYDENLSGVFFDELDIAQPDYHLGIGGGSHGSMTGRQLEAIETVLVDERPDWVLVYGDTNSTLAGALAAAKLHICVAHVEAGLRSFNRAMPEEINRLVADHVSHILFTPTDAATNNLLSEGVPEARIYQVGDVMFDASRFYGEKAERESRILRQYGLEWRSYVLATIHRQENTDDPARILAIFEGLRRVALEMPVILPLHPRTRTCLAQFEDRRLTEGITLLSPVSYLDMVMLERSAAVIATDSGGVQKEAYFHGVPCVTLRDETEWVELIDAGWNRLAPPRSLDIAEKVLDARGQYGVSCELYGDGHASSRIVDRLVDQCGVHNVFISKADA